MTERAARGESEAFLESSLCPAYDASRLRGGSNDKDFDIRAILAGILMKLEKLENLPTEVDGIEKAIHLMSEKHDEVRHNVARQEAQIKQLRKGVDAVEVRNDKKEVKQLTLTADDLELRSRRQNLVIHGVLVMEDEQGLSKVNDVERLAKLPDLGPNDVEAVHRLPAKSGKVPGIIVRFNKQQLRDEFRGTQELSFPIICYRKPS